MTLLNLADVCGTHACPGGECRLGETLLLSILVDSRSKKLKQRGRVVWLQAGRSARRSHRIPPPPGGQRITRDGRGKSGVGVQSYKQPGGRNTQDMRETEQRQHRNIALPQFDLADIGAAYARAGGECLLGQEVLLPVLTEGRPKTLQRCILRVWCARWRVTVGHRRIPSLLRV